MEYIFVDHQRDDLNQLLWPGVLEGGKLPYESVMIFQFIIMTVVYNNNSNYIYKQFNLL